MASMSEPWLQSTDSKADVMRLFSIFLEDSSILLSLIAYIYKCDTPPCAPKAIYYPLGENLMS